MARRKRSRTRRTGRRGAWPAHLSARLRALRRRMRDGGLDAMLVTEATDIRYLTGFSGEDSWALVKPRSALVISDQRFAQELAENHPYLRAVMRKGPITDALVKQVRAAGIEKLGFQGEHVSVRLRRALVRQLGASALKETGGWLIGQRAVKDEPAVAGIRKAISIQQRAYRWLLDELEPGMSEREVAALLEYHMRALGADGPSFPTIVASGANAAKPHYMPGAAKVRKDVPLLIDFGAQRDGYCGDLTRVVTVGRLRGRMRRVYELVLEAQRAALEKIAPGVGLKEVDAAARDRIKAAGYGERFGHGLGHGLGLEVHEQPVLSPRSEGELRPGHVVTVEPGVYLPGVGGVRIEDDVLITERGRRVLSSLPKGLDSAMI